MDVDETRQGASGQFFSPTKSAGPSLKDPFELFQELEPSPASPANRRPAKKRRRLDLNTKVDAVYT